MEQLILHSDIRDDSDTNIDVYVCKHCTEVFSNKSTLKAHQVTHSMIVDNRCGSCKTQFKSLYKLRHHNCIKKFICSVCSDTLPSLKMKKKHELEHHHNEHGHLCKTCGKKFQHKYNLDHHLVSEHSNSIKEFRCSKCPRRFKFKTRLDYHMRSAHSTNSHICIDCNIDYKSAVILKQHNIHKHSGINKKVKCLECDLQVLVHSLRQHMNTHVDQEKKIPIVCHTCNQPFATQALLENHNKKCHIQCELCRLMFSSKFTYKSHLLKTHGDEENSYVCPQCSKVFISESKRNRHLVIHSSTASFKCNICEFQSNFQDNLDQHVLMKHSNWKPFKCDKCPWKFKRSCDLQRHQKIHVNEKAYFYCKFCEKKFEHSSNKTKHEKKYHSSNQYEVVHQLHDLN